MDKGAFSFLTSESHNAIETMKDYYKPRRKGFTLIELLVVIVIIVTLMSILVPVVGAARKRATKVEAKNTLTTLVSSVDAYYNDYNRLPANSASPPSQDQEVETTEPIMSLLAGINIDQLNIKQNVYFNGSAAKGASKGSAYKGLWEDSNSAVLYDNWRKKANRGYIMLLDYGYDEKLDDPFRPGRRIGGRVVAWTSGKDGQWNGSNPNKGANKDNVYSWF